MWMPPIPKTETIKINYKTSIPQTNIQQLQAKHYNHPTTPSAAWKSPCSILACARCSQITGHRGSTCDPSFTINQGIFWRLLKLKWGNVWLLLLLLLLYLGFWCLFLNTNCIWHLQTTEIYINLDSRCPHIRSAWHCHGWLANLLKWFKENPFHISLDRPWLPENHLLPTFCQELSQRTLLGF